MNDDVISREQAIEELNKLVKHYATKEPTSMENEMSICGRLLGLGKAIDAIRTMPCVMLEKPKQGTWHISHGMYNDRMACTCGFIKLLDERDWRLFRFCPGCGGPKESEGKSDEG